MTDHQFKNGITIHIPDDMPNQLEQWTEVKLVMSLLLSHPPLVEKVRKPYSMKNRAAQIKKRTKSWHKRSKK